MSGESRGGTSSDAAVGRSCDSARFGNFGSSCVEDSGAVVVADGMLIKGVGWG